MIRIEFRYLVYKGMLYYILNNKFNMNEHYSLLANPLHMKVKKYNNLQESLDDDIIKGLLKKFPYYDTPDLYEQSVKLIIFEKIEKILEEIILSNIVEEVITKSINTALNNIIDE